MAISRDEWLAALGDAAQPCDPGAMTLVEIAKEFKIHRQTAYRKVLALIADGRAVATFKVIATLNGGTRRVAAYRLLPPATKAKRAA